MLYFIVNNETLVSLPFLRNWMYTSRTSSVSLTMVHHLDHGQSCTPKRLTMVSRSVISLTMVHHLDHGQSCSPKRLTMVSIVSHQFDHGPSSWPWSELSTTMVNHVSIILTMVNHVLTDIDHDHHGLTMITMVWPWSPWFDHGCCDQPSYNLR